VKTEEKRQAIVAVAREVFRKKGYATASMAEISAALGGSKGTLYSYFDSKEELFAAVIAELASIRGRPRISELEHALDWREALGNLVLDTVRLFCSPEVVDYRRMIIAEAGRSGIGKLAYEKGPKPLMQKLAGLLAEYMRLGHLREAEPWTAAVHLQGLCLAGPAEQLLEGVIDRVSEKEIAATASAVLDVFLRAYASDPPSPQRSRARRKRSAK
jgi:AcrR family transcriptional regulator